MNKKSGDKSYYGVDKIRTNDKMRAKWPDLPTSISPLPYYPTLRRALRSHGAAVLLVYLEVFHSIDTTIVLDHIQQELQITKRNWWWVASAITTMHTSKNNRRIAQIAHREFVRDSKAISGLITPYSLTALDPQRKTWEIRRNQTTLENLLTKASLTSAIIQRDAKRLPRRPVTKSDVRKISEAKAPQCSPSAVDHANKLSDVIEKALAQRRNHSRLS